MDVQQEKETEKERRGQGVQGRAQPSDLAGGPAGLASHLLHGAPALQAPSRPPRQPRPPRPPRTLPQPPAVQVSLWPGPRCVWQGSHLLGAGPCELRSPSFP